MSNKRDDFFYTKESNSQLLSEFITLTRFPLIILVVLIHGHFIPDGYSLPYNSYISEFPIYCNVSYLCSELLARVAVPLFFAISGYLFFKKNTETFSLNDYKYKIRTRVYSLFIPYVFWNALILVLTLFVQIQMGGGGDAIIYYSINEYFRAFWDIRNGMPFCYQLWFIRDLMVMSLISPIIYYLIKDKRIALFIILLSAIWWFIDIDNVRWYLNSQTVLFFCVGAYFALHPFDLVGKLLHTKSISYIASFILVFLVMISFNSGYFYQLSQTLRQFFYHLCILSLIVSFIICCLDNIVARTRCVNKYILDSTFFIYGYHAIALGYFNAFINKVIQFKSDLILVTIYFLTPIIVVILGLFIFAIVKRVFPKFAGLITGGRI